MRINGRFILLDTNICLKLLFLSPFRAVHFTEFFTVQVIWDYGCQNIIFEMLVASVIRRYTMMTLAYLHRIISSPLVSLLKFRLWTIFNNYWIAKDCVILDHLKVLLNKYSTDATLWSGFHSIATS